MVKQINAEWIWYLKAYRLYDACRPQQCIAYVESLEGVHERLEEEYGVPVKLVECDSDSMHVECC